MQRDSGSDLFSSFGPRDRLVQLRRLVQDAIDVFEGLVMSHEARVRARADLEVHLDPPEGVEVRRGEPASEISLPDAQGTALPAR